ncbi:MAG: ankyrin repeat domain-containing protein [Sedimentisphaerales bacterium]|nr:ankyrin repeat domain-containing protein [Sedimentisphaerales bacterium]
MKVSRYFCLFFTLVLIVPGCKKRPSAYTIQLHQAAKEGDIEQLKLLISEGINVNERDSNKWTALHEAAYNIKIEAAKFDRKDVAELLIAKGVNINEKDNHGYTALHYAARGHKNIVELLITNGADVNVKNKWNRTFLDIAVGRGHTEIAELLRRHGAKE